MRCTSTILRLVSSIICCGSAAAHVAESWQSPYTGADASGNHVIAFWNFDADGPVKDISGKGHDGTLSGSSWRADGKLGGCVELFPGGPVEDVRHAVVVPNAPDLSPKGAFTLEMWVRPGDASTGHGEAFLLDKRYVAHTDYQWILETPNKPGKRRARAVLGFGEDSDTWWSTELVTLQPGTWSHLAMTYDGAGAVNFIQDGHSLGGATKPGRGNIIPGEHPLSLGDRIGSTYHGFPGALDEIRITSGVREFRPLTVAQEYVRTAYQRMESAPPLKFRLTNNTRQPIRNLEAGVEVGGVASQSYRVAELAAGASQTIDYALDTTLRPDSYRIEVAFRFGEGEAAYADRQRFPVVIVSRKPAHRMPVVMWGIGGCDDVIKYLPALKEIGFSHCLGLQCDLQKIWDAGAPTQAVSDKDLPAGYRMLDQALANDLGIIIDVSAGMWLEKKPEYYRRDATGKPYPAPNICGNFPALVPFARNVGASVSQTYGAFPAFEAALIDTEVRDGTQICFHDHDVALCRAATGKGYPKGAEKTNGVQYSSIAGFPANRVISDDDDLLRFYKWFWKDGDGWNAFHSAVNDGLKSTPRKALWTFFDPAVRVPALWGSGGNVDFISHWTYSYPDPIRIGLATDELFAMAKGGPNGQGVMKMTQIIWYRSQTAPSSSPTGPTKAQSPWEDRDPDADYITIAPAHLREAFWTKIARPVKGIMYHGWQSLVPTGGPSVYRYTHPETRHALAKLISNVVEPLGPTLMQVPAAPSQVAFLESFASDVFAGRGTYGWGSSWAGDAYLVLQYAHLQPEIVYEESILRTGLDGYKALVLMDCDVLPASVVQKVTDFQRAGGILIGDDRLCPAVIPDLRISRYERTEQADVDKAALVERAKTLAEQLGDRLQNFVISSAGDVIPYYRRYGASIYVFAINDRREFGAYVGSHKLVMEQGLNAAADLGVRIPNAIVYDLVEHRRIDTTTVDGMTRWPVELEPGGGALWLVTANPIERLTLQAGEEARRSSPYKIQAAVTGASGNSVDAVIPIEVRVADPDGRPAEFSGYYGAVAGKLDLNLTFAPNDLLGVWTIDVKELASGLRARHFVRLSAR